jgi:hypothetical protein
MFLRLGIFLSKILWYSAVFDKNPINNSLRFFIDFSFSILGKLMLLGKPSSSSIVFEKPRDSRKSSPSLIATRP